MGFESTWKKTVKQSYLESIISMSLLKNENENENIFFSFSFIFSFFSFKYFVTL